MEQTAVKCTHAGWREDEIDALWNEIRQANASGQPLRSVFETMGDRLGRKPNSVRNYYYMQLRARDSAAVRRAAPFETFTEQEVRSLVRAVLAARAQGQSVRACVMELAQGDHALMLRYQNKYRSVLKKRPELIAEICRDLEDSGITVSLPAVQQKSTQEMRDEIAVKAAALGDPDVSQMLGGLNALLDRALKHDPQLRHDRLQVQLDMALLHHDALCRAAGDMLLLCKEYLGQEEDTRFAALPAFLTSLTQHVSAVENAMH